MNTRGGVGWARARTTTAADSRGWGQLQGQHPPVAGCRASSPVSPPGARWPQKTSAGRPPWQLRAGSLRPCRPASARIHRTESVSPLSPTEAGCVECQLCGCTLRSQGAAQLSPAPPRPAEAERASGGVAGGGGTCSRILTRSKGAVRVLPMAPATAPAANSTACLGSKASAASGRCSSSLPPARAAPQHTASHRPRIGRTADLKLE